MGGFQRGKRRPKNNSNSMDEDIIQKRLEMADGSTASHYSQYRQMHAGLGLGFGFGAVTGEPSTVI